MEDRLWVLKDTELDLVRELESERLAEVDEDGLLALHKRVRRARNKHVKRYRRDAASRVKAAGARGAAAPTSDKARLRASVFEEALSRISAQLAKVAHEEAEALKDERLARAESKPAGPSTQTSHTGGVPTKGRARKHTKTTGGKKRDASSAAQGAKRQAKRDS